MLKKLLPFLLMICTISVFAQDKADIKTLQNFVKNFSSFSANFIQTQPDDSIFSINESMGYMGIKRPGKLFWIYQDPDQQEIIADGKNLWIYDVELDQVSVRPLSSVQADFPMRWLLYDEPIERNFNILIGDKINGVSWFNLMPKDSTYFKSLDVAIAGNKLVKIWMYQDSDNITKVIFQDSTIKNIDDAEFKFILHKGVDLIGQPIR